MKINRDNTEVVMYQPQIESFTGNKMEARAAISVTGLEYTNPVFGAMWFDCNVSTDRDERVVHLEGLKVVAAKFPDIEEEKINSLKSFLKRRSSGIWSFPWTSCLQIWIRPKHL
jgi:hypothetical protein